MSKRDLQISKRDLQISKRDLHNKQKRPMKQTCDNCLSCAFNRAASDDILPPTTSLADALGVSAAAADLAAVVAVAEVWVYVCVSVKRELYIMAKETYSP